MRPQPAFLGNGLAAGARRAPDRSHRLGEDLSLPHTSQRSCCYIIIAGAAGLRLGHSMLFPGGYRWKDSLAKGGVEATRLVSGIIPLLVIAGCLEGFFSPSPAPVWPRARAASTLHRHRRPQRCTIPC